MGFCGTFIPFLCPGIPSHLSEAEAVTQDTVRLSLRQMKETDFIS